jgi:hypothetical protein
MPLGSIGRELLHIPVTAFAGALTAAGSETTKLAISNIKAPVGGKLRKVYASYAVEGGASGTPSVEITVERGAIVLATLATLSVPNVFAEAELNVAVDYGDELNFKADVDNTDNFFEGLVIVAEFTLANPFLDE